MGRAKEELLLRPARQVSEVHIRLGALPKQALAGSMLERVEEGEGGEWTVYLY